MSNLTDTINNIVEDVSDEAVVQDETLEVAVEANEEEVVVEQSTESDEVSEEVSEEEVEEVAEAKVKEEDDEEEEEEEAEASAPAAPSIPKTKAGVINAAVEMLKKAKKHEAQQIFAKMVKNIEESEDDGSVDKAIDAQKKKEKDKTVKAKPSDASPKQESADWEEDLDLIVANEATLSDGFRGKAGAIFEAAYTQKVSAEIDRLESEYAQNLETEISDVQTEIVEKVDNYLNYVVEGWMKENEVAIQQGLRTEIAEEFMTSLQSVFKEHYIEVPEGKADLIDDLADQVSELEEQLNKTTEDNIQLNNSNQDYLRANIVRKQSSGLADTESEKLAGLVEDIEFEDAETFEMKVKTIKESYFTQDSPVSVDESDALIGEDGNSKEQTSSSMSAYTQAITKLNNQ
jgi:hypothetical protein